MEHAGRIAEVHMAMILIIIILKVANFLSVTIHKEEKNIKLYILYAAGLAGIYLLLALIQTDITFINDIKKFYEITYLPPVHWKPVLLVSMGASAVLIGLQFIRRKIIFKD
jgi:hypothetical protein